MFFLDASVRTKNRHPVRSCGSIPKLFLSSPISVLYHPRRHHRKSLKLPEKGVKKTAVFPVFPSFCQAFEAAKAAATEAAKAAATQAAAEGVESYAEQIASQQAKVRRIFGGVAVEVFLDGDPGANGKLGRGRCSWLHC